jgi:hypothetical protein
MRFPVNKIMLPIHTTQRHIAGVALHFHLFLAPVKNGGKRSASQSGRVTSEKTPLTSRVAEYVGLRASLDVL